MADIYGVDIALREDDEAKPSGDFNTLEGLENVKEALFRRLLTTKGTLIHRPDYGVGIKDFQGALNAFSNHRILSGRIVEQFSLDPRVEEVLGVSITNTDRQPELIKINVRVKVVGYSEQTFSFIPFGETI